MDNSATYRAKQKHVCCEKCGWKTRRVYNEDINGFGFCCNKECSGKLRKTLSATKLNRVKIFEEMRNHEI